MQKKILQGITDEEKREAETEAETETEGQREHAPKCMTREIHTRKIHINKSWLNNDEFEK